MNSKKSLRKGHGLGGTLWGPGWRSIAGLLAATACMAILPLRALPVREIPLRELLQKHPSGAYLLDLSGPYRIVEDAQLSHLNLPFLEWDSGTKNWAENAPLSHFEAQYGDKTHCPARWGDLCRRLVYELSREESTSLKELFLGASKSPNSNCIQDLMPVLQFAYIFLPGLTLLDLSGNLIGFELKESVLKQLQAFWTLSDALPALEQLNLSECQIAPSQIRAFMPLLRRPRFLELVCLGNSGFLSPDAIEALRGAQTAQKPNYSDRFSRATYSGTQYNSKGAGIQPDSLLQLSKRGRNTLLSEDETTPDDRGEAILEAVLSEKINFMKVVLDYSPKTELPSSFEMDLLRKVIWLALRNLGRAAAPLAANPEVLYGVLWAHVAYYDNLPETKILFDYFLNTPLDQAVRSSLQTIEEKISWMAPVVESRLRLNPALGPHQGRRWLYRTCWKEILQASAAGDYKINSVPASGDKALHFMKLFTLIPPLKTNLQENLETFRAIGEEWHTSSGLARMLAHQISNLFFLKALRELKADLVEQRPLPLGDVQVHASSLLETFFSAVARCYQKPEPANPTPQELAQLAQAALKIARDGYFLGQKAGINYRKAGKWLRWVACIGQNTESSAAHPLLDPLRAEALYYLGQITGAGVAIESESYPRLMHVQQQCNQQARKCNIPVCGDAYRYGGTEFPQTLAQTVAQYEEVFRKAPAGTVPSKQHLWQLRQEWLEQETSKWEGQWRAQRYLPDWLKAFKEGKSEQSWSEYLGEASPSTLPW